MEDFLKKLGALLESITPNSCPSCGLHGTPKTCPKCSRLGCTSCVAEDNTDCMFCGINGDIALKCFKPLHERYNK